MAADERFELVNLRGDVIGFAPRRLVHADNRLLHRVVHVVVTNARGHLLLQRRSLAKDIAPGVWDTSVGGHLLPGETVAEGARREMREELGLDGEPTFLYSWLYRSARESELVHTHHFSAEGPFVFPPQEIDQVRFWSPEEIESHLGTQAVSSQLALEYARFSAFRRGCRDFS
jgi:isopentenyldiphosphate isomerase